jgi:hypothetical protein
LAALHHEEDD